MGLKGELIQSDLALLTSQVRQSIDKLRELLSSDFLEIGASGDYFGLSEVLSSLPEDVSQTCHAQDFEFRML